jgi:hypothetical protein
MNMDDYQNSGNGTPNNDYVTPPQQGYTPPQQGTHLLNRVRTSSAGVHTPGNYSAPPSKGKATASLVLGIVSLVVAWFGWGAIVAIVLAIIGIILGVGARKELTPEQGRGLATAGMICSIIALALSAIVFISCVICASALTSYGWYY